MNVKSRQQENAEATREALLESALSAFIEHGYGGVSIDAIAREARVTKGAFYHHFGSKQELLAECYERQVRTIAEDLDRCRRMSTSGRRPPHWPRPSSTA